MRITVVAYATRQHTDTKYVLENTLQIKLFIYVVRSFDLKSRA
jgi:hypothetical protein